jgi:hypothetical protein
MASSRELESGTAIMMDLRLIDIYRVNGRPYYCYNFVLWMERKMRKEYKLNQIIHMKQIN